MAISGHCLCKGVRFEVRESPTAMGTCHCTRCQRSGSSGTVVVIPEGSLHFTHGKDLLKTFSEEGFSARHFCTNCGSLVYGGGGAMTYVSAGALVDDPGMRPQFHIMVDHKAPWDEIHDDLPQFGEYPPSG